MASVPLEQWASTVVLGDGDTALIRPITPADRDELRAFHERQSPESRYRRYFSAKPTLTDTELDHFTIVDFRDRVALVAERRGELIGWASYERWANRDDAEAAFHVDDRHQGKGVATLLLEHLASIARTNGIHRFTAEVLADNRAMLSVFARAGWPLQRRFDSGVVDVDFELDDTAEFVDTVERREQRADSRAMARLLLPRSIAVVGASDRPGSVGRALWHNVARGFDGPVFPVNPAHDKVGGYVAYPSLRDVPGEVTLAVIAVPHEQLVTTIDDCIATRVRGAIVVTATDGVSIDLAELVARARRNGLRIIGPASMGIASPRSDVGIQASIVDVRLPEGGVAISLQSGTLGSSVLRLAGELQMGMSWFVSLGDRSDVSGNDLLQFWLDDEATTVVAMYTETLGNPRKFARIARHVAQRKPIVVVRTGAAMIGPGTGALYQQAGLIEVPTVVALLDTARVMATQPPLRGPRVAVLTNSRSPGVLARAAIRTAGLEPTDPPLELSWRSTDADYEQAVRAALDDDRIDGVLVMHAPPVASAVGGPVDEIDRAAHGASKPVVAVLLGRAGVRVPRAGCCRARPRVLVLALAPDRGCCGAGLTRRHRRGGGNDDHHRRARHGPHRTGPRRDPRAARGVRRRDGARPARAVRRRGRGRSGAGVPGRRQGSAPTPRPVGAGGSGARSRRPGRGGCDGVGDARAPRVGCRRGHRAAHGAARCRHAPARVHRPRVGPGRDGRARRCAGRRDRRRGESARADVDDERTDDARSDTRCDGAGR
jgi:succinyl-CoA synthetase alpha subunit/RimJ/RimL family protein N-acetyltransferase